MSSRQSRGLSECEPLEAAGYGPLARSFISVWWPPEGGTSLPQSELIETMVFGLLCFSSAES